MKQKTTRHIRLFVSSPNDVSDARDVVEEVANEIQSTLGEFLDVTIECLRWERDVFPKMGRPQQAVMDQLMPAQADIFIGILWLRFGSAPGPAGEGGDRTFQSGTEEEFQLAYERWSKVQSPEIMFYRCIKSPLDMSIVDPEQFKRVSEFFARFSPAGETPGFVRSYQELEEFRRLLKRDILSILRKLVPYSGVKEGTSLSPEHVENGFRALYVQPQNEIRNASKRRCILEAKTISLLALNAHSYLAAQGHRFREELQTALNGGARFRAVLLNPWSRAGLLVARLRDRTDNDPVTQVRESTYYSVSFRSSILGFRTLDDEYPGLLDVRLTNSGFTATCLFTEHELFFEPYLWHAQKMRLDRNMTTFEVECSSNSYLYEYASSYFESLFSQAEPLGAFMRSEDKFVERFAAYGLE